MKFFARTIVAALWAVGAASPGNASTCGAAFDIKRVDMLATARGAAAKGTLPLDPAIADVMSKVAKSYSCQRVVNYYAAKVGLPNDIVHNTAATSGTTVDARFSSKVYADICGRIQYGIPIAIDVPAGLSDVAARVARAKRTIVDTIGPKLPGASNAENDAFKALHRKSMESFIEAEQRLNAEVDSLSGYFLPDGRHMPRPTSENIRFIVDQLQLRLVEAYASLIAEKRWTLAEKDRFVASAGCTSLLPSPTGPNEQIMSAYGSAVIVDFSDVAKLLSAGLRP